MEQKILQKQKRCIIVILAEMDGTDLQFTFKPAKEGQKKMPL
jgi:hypothetical protein